MKLVLFAVLLLLVSSRSAVHKSPAQEARRERTIDEIKDRSHSPR
jgi:hypothetical protein